MMFNSRITYRFHDQPRTFALFGRDDVHLTSAFRLKVLSSTIQGSMRFQHASDPSQQVLTYGTPLALPELLALGGYLDYGELNRYSHAAPGTAPAFAEANAAELLQCADMLMMPDAKAKAKQMLVREIGLNAFLGCLRTAESPEVVEILAHKLRQYMTLSSSQTKGLLERISAFNSPYEPWLQKANDLISTDAPILACFSCTDPGIKFSGYPEFALHLGKAAATMAVDEVRLESVFGGSVTTEAELCNNAAALLPATLCLKRRSQLAVAAAQARGSAATQGTGEPAEDGHEQRSKSLRLSDAPAAALYASAGVSVLPRRIADKTVELRNGLGAGLSVTFAHHKTQDGEKEHMVVRGLPASQELLGILAPLLAISEPVDGGYPYAPEQCDHAAPTPGIHTWCPRAHCHLGPECPDHKLRSAEMQGDVLKTVVAYLHPHLAKNVTVRVALPFEDEYGEDVCRDCVVSLPLGLTYMAKLLGAHHVASILEQALHVPQGEQALTVAQTKERKQNARVESRTLLQHVGTLTVPPKQAADRAIVAAACAAKVASISRALHIEETAGRLSAEDQRQLDCLRRLGIFPAKDPRQKDFFELAGVSMGTRGVSVVVVKDADVEVGPATDDQVPRVFCKKEADGFLDIWEHEQDETIVGTYHARTNIGVALGDAVGGVSKCEWHAQISHAVFNDVSASSGQVPLHFNIWCTDGVLPAERMGGAHFEQCIGVDQRLIGKRMVVTLHFCDPPTANSRFHVSLCVGGQHSSHLESVWFPVQLPPFFAHTSPADLRFMVSFGLPRQNALSSAPARQPRRRYVPSFGPAAGSSGPSSAPAASSANGPSSAPSGPAATSGVEDPTSEQVDELSADRAPYRLRIKLLPPPKDTAARVAP